MPTYRLTIPVYVEADTLAAALEAVTAGEGDTGPVMTDTAAAAVEAVRALHCPSPSGRDDADNLRCDACRQVWPCSTRRTITEAEESPTVTPATTDSDRAAAYAATLTADPAALAAALEPRLVGSGFADSDTTCPTCHREILTGWQAWVTAWDDLDRTAFHPGCAGPCRTCEAITGRDPVTGYCARCARD